MFFNWGKDKTADCIYTLRSQTIRVMVQLSIPISNSNSWQVFKTDLEMTGFNHLTANNYIIWWLNCAIIKGNTSKKLFGRVYVVSNS